jgi:hypothetical protein
MGHHIIATLIVGYGVAKYIPLLIAALRGNM